MKVSDLGKTCNFQGWKKLYHRMFQLRTSELLATVFDNYSIWRGEGVPKEMTREKVREFLQPPGSLGHQNESNVTEDSLTNMIQVQICFHSKVSNSIVFTLMTCAYFVDEHSCPVNHKVIAEDFRSKLAFNMG